MNDEELEMFGVKEKSSLFKSLALCKDMDTEMFYSRYESDYVLAGVVDEMCLSCPIMKQCGLKGIDGSEWGVWGGVYLTRGTPDDNKNSHKTEEVWNRIRSRFVE